MANQALRYTRCVLNNSLLYLERFTTKLPDSRADIKLNGDHMNTEGTISIIISGT